MQATAVFADTTIIPFAQVSGRYDSNIFNRPKQLLEPGTQVSDFVTIAGGGLELKHETRDIDVNLKTGGTFNTYLEHSSRNFFNVNFSGEVGLDRWIDRYFRGASLSIRENLRYSPEPPGFLVGARDPAQNDTFFSGVQGFRASALISTTDLRGTYPVSRDLSIEGGYTFGIRRMGQIQGGDVPGVSYFNTITNTFLGGPRYKLTRNDSIAALTRYSHYTQANASGGRTIGTNLITFLGEYAKEFPEWRFDVQGGITLAEPAGRSFPSGSLRISTRPERDTALNLLLIREGRPSFFLQGGANINNRAQIGFSHKVYERLIVDGYVAYALTELLPDTRGSFKFLTAAPKVKYKITRNIDVDLTYVYSNVDNSATAIQYQVSRHLVGFMLTGFWD